MAVGTAVASAAVSLRCVLTFNILLLIFFTVSAKGFLFNDGELFKSCSGRCGNGVNNDYDCQCNQQCTRYNDCCDDYQAKCQDDDKIIESCEGRCWQGIDKDYGCQCNRHCTRFNDCCDDYQAKCQATTSIAPTRSTIVKCKTFSQMGQALWDSDVHRMTSADLTLNYQSQVIDGSTTDKAPAKLFRYVDRSKLATPTFAAYRVLLDNFNPTKGKAEVDSKQEEAEINAFMTAVLDSKVMTVMYDFLKCQGKVSSKDDLKAILNKLWFEKYARNYIGPNLDSSGFEHIMVGEYKNNLEVNGFHSWVSFYEKEKAGEINYLGYVSKTNMPSTLGSAFSWNGHFKARGTFFVGTSPEFDMAIYSLCYLIHPKDTCYLPIAGHNVKIKTYDNRQGNLGTAFLM